MKNLTRYPLLLALLLLSAACSVTPEETVSSEDPTLLEPTVFAHVCVPVEPETSTREHPVMVLYVCDGVPGVCDVENVVCDGKPVFANPKCEWVGPVEYPNPYGARDGYRCSWF